MNPLRLASLDASPFSQSEKGEGRALAALGTPLYSPSERGRVSGCVAKKGRERCPLCPSDISPVNEGNLCCAVPGARGGLLVAAFAMSKR